MSHRQIGSMKPWFPSASISFPQPQDVTDMMRNNLGKVMERGERIDSLLDKTSALKAESVWNLDC